MRQTPARPIVTLPRRRARELNAWTYTLYLAYRDPRVAWPARLFTLAVVAYAFSPIDLIPDFIPVLGYLDDLILVPFGIALAIRLIPPGVLADCRARAAERLDAKRATRSARRTESPPASSSRSGCSRLPSSRSPSRELSAGSTHPPLPTSPPRGGEETGDGAWRHEENVLLGSPFPRGEGGRGLGPDRPRLRTTHSRNS